MVKITPLAAAAVGAAAAFYPFRAMLAAGELTGKPALKAAIWLLCLACLLAAAALALLLLSPKQARLDGRTLLAASIGLVLGLTAASPSLPDTGWGVPLQNIVTVTARQVGDARRLTGGSHLLQVRLIKTHTENGTTASAQGLVTVLCPAPVGTSGPVFGASQSRGTPQKRSTPLVRGAVLELHGTVTTGRLGPVFKARTVTVLTPAPAWERARNKIRAIFFDQLEAPAAGSQLSAWKGLALALLLGAKDGLDSDTSALYTQAGCAHVLALSGMHLALLSALLTWLLKPLLGLKPAAALSLFFVLAYVYLAGSQPSLVRSAIMYALVATAVLADLPRQLLCTLAGAFLIQLCFSPQEAVSVSFILSYLALAGIALVAGPAESLLRAWVPDWIRPALAASIAAFLGTAAASTGFFGTLHPAGIISSLVLSPLANVIMAGALLYLPLNSLHPQAGAAVNAILEQVGRLNQAIVRWAASLPHFDIAAGLPGLGQRGSQAATLAVLGISLVLVFILVYGHHTRNSIRNRFDLII